MAAYASASRREINESHAARGLELALRDVCLHPQDMHSRMDRPSGGGREGSPEWVEVTSGRQRDNRPPSRQLPFVKRVASPWHAAQLPSDVRCAEDRTRSGARERVAAWIPPGYVGSAVAKRSYTSAGQVGTVGRV